MSDKIHFQNIFVPGMQVANNRIPIPLANGNFWRAQQGGYSIGVTPDRVVYLSKDGVDYVEQFTLEFDWGTTDNDFLGAFVKQVGNAYVISNARKDFDYWHDRFEKRNPNTGEVQSQVEFPNNFYQHDDPENEHNMRVCVLGQNQYVFTQSDDYLFSLGGVVVEDATPEVPLDPRSSPGTVGYFRASSHWGSYASSIPRYFTTRISETLHTSEVFYQTFSRIISPRSLYEDNVISIGPVLSSYGDIKSREVDDYNNLVYSGWSSPNRIEFDFNVVYQDQSVPEAPINHYASGGPFHVVVLHWRNTNIYTCNTSFSVSVPGMVSCTVRVATGSFPVETQMGDISNTTGRRVGAMLNPRFYLNDVVYGDSIPEGTAYVIVYPESIKLRFQTCDYRGIPMMQVSKINSDFTTTELHTPSVSYTGTLAAQSNHTFVENGVLCPKYLTNYSDGNVDATWPELVDADTGEIVFLKYSGPHKIIPNYTSNLGFVSFLGEDSTSSFKPWLEIPNLFVCKDGYQEALLTLPEYFLSALNSLPYDALEYTAFTMSYFVTDTSNSGYIFNTGYWSVERYYFKILIASVSGALHLESNQGVCKINGALYSIMSSVDGITFSELSGGAVVNEIVVPHASTASIYADKTRVVLVSPTEILYPTTNTLINLQTWESTPYLEAWWEDPAQAVPGTFRGLAVGSGKRGLHYYVERVGATNGTFFQLPGGEVKPHVCAGTHLNLSATMYFYDGAFITDAYQPYFSTTFEIESEGE